MARTRYIAAARRFVHIFSALLARGVPIDPGEPTAAREWTRQDIATLRALHEALGDMLKARRDWDAIRRHHRP